MMVGPYLDGMTVGEIKQQADDQIAYASRYIKEKAAQQRREILRFVPQKRKDDKSQQENGPALEKKKGGPKINALNVEE